MKPSKHFLTGSEVAVDFGSGMIHHRKVGKVYKSGKFLLEDAGPAEPELPRQWRPNGDRAYLVGDGPWGRSWATPWTDALAQEAIRQRLERRHNARCRALVEVFARPNNLDQDFVNDIIKFVAARAVAGYGKKQ